MNHQNGWSDEYLERLVSLGLFKNKDSALKFLHQHEAEIQSGVEFTKELVQRDWQ